MAAKRLILAIALAAFAIGLGWALGFGFINLVNAVAPMHPEDKGTARDFLPIAIGYFIWAVTATQVFLIGWRSIKQRS
ncbi:MAG TPA: hypothetical protein VNH13_03175 [Candidatus Acidoferrales bacterium]|jgi:hypothetical protein|nr:hypothetical protein [Candidatus Acidoferrales bacterium]